MAKLTFDEALERIGDQHPLRASEVQTNALRRKLWLAEWHLPGCLSESQAHCLTKEDAIEAACGFTGDEPPRGMKTALRKHGRFDTQSEMFGTCINTVSQVTLADIL